MLGKDADLNITNSDLDRGHIMENQTFMAKNASISSMPTSQ